jgi:hypothetical protein
VTLVGTGFVLSMRVYHGMSRKNAKYTMENNRARFVYSGVGGIKPR